MLSASQILKKSINLTKFNKKLFTNVRLLSVNLNQNVKLNEQSTKFRNPRIKSEIELLETNTRKYGRIDPFILQNCIDNLDKIEDFTSRETLLLLKCCGPLLHNRSKIKRNEYLTKLWKSFKKKRMPLDVMHYNLLIKTYTENNHQFDPEELMNEMKDANIKPNKRTYEFVIHKYCLDGNLDKVTKILEQLNEENSSLTAPMFDSLILGHFVNKDIDQALETFKIMKESSIEITNSTYKNMIIGYLKNYNSDEKIIDRIMDLINEKSIKLEITEIIEIIEHMNADQLKGQKINELKDLLIRDIKENENYYNDFANCFYVLLVNDEYEIAKKLFNSHFNDSLDEAKDRFVRRLVNSFIKSDLVEFEKPIKFLRELHPGFDFLKYSKNVLAYEILSLEELLNIFNKFIVNDRDLGAPMMLLERCKNMNEVHTLVEFYLKKLIQPKWINNIKACCLMRIQMDPIKFCEEHLKRNKDEKSVELLTISLFCYYMDELDLDKLKEIKKKFNPNVLLLSNSYAIEKAGELIKNKPDQINEFLELIKEKIEMNQKFNKELFKFLLDNLEDRQLKSLIDFYDKHQLNFPFGDLDNKDMNRLKRLERKKYKTTIEEFKERLVNGEEIQINDELFEFRNRLNQRQVSSIFLSCIASKNYKIAKFFYSPYMLLTKPTLLRFVELKLANGEDKSEVIKFFDDHFEDTHLEQLYSLNPLIIRIFDYIRDENKLVYTYLNRISTVLDPLDLHYHLIHFFDKTKDDKIGENLITLTVFLLKSNINRIFATMIAFIEARNTSLLQAFCDKLVKSDVYKRSKVYGELAMAFVYTERYKQAIKVIQTDEFQIGEWLGSIFKHLLDKDKKEIIKKFSILVYQNSPRSRKFLLDYLNDWITNHKQHELFQEILTDIKNLSLAKQNTDEQTTTDVHKIKDEKELIKDSIEDSIELFKRKGNQSKEQLIDLVHQIIAKKKELKLNVECNLIDKLISYGELDKTADLIYDMLKNERYPIPATIKNVLKEFNLNGKLELIEKLEPHLPLPLKESEFYKSNKILTYLRTTKSETEIANCLKQINMFSSDLIEQILTIKPEFEKQIIDVLKERKKSNLNYVWLHFMKKSQFDKALNLVNDNDQDLDAKNLIFQPILNLLKQNNSFELAKHLVEYATRFELKSNTVQTIYNLYIKLCLINNNLDEAKRTIQQAKSKVQLNLDNLDENLINKLDKQFIDEFIKNQKN